MVYSMEIELMDKVQFIVDIVCEKCKLTFGVDSKYLGVITCPYCGEYVEG